MTPLDRVLERFDFCQKRLADALGVSPQFVQALKRRGGKLTTRKISINEWERVSGLNRKELFPEFFS